MLPLDQSLLARRSKSGAGAPTWYQSRNQTTRRRQAALWNGAVGARLDSQLANGFIRKSGSPAVASVIVVRNVSRMRPRNSPRVPFRFRVPGRCSDIQQQPGGASRTRPTSSREARCTSKRSSTSVSSPLRKELSWILKYQGYRRVGNTNGILYSPCLLGICENPSTIYIRILEVSRSTGDSDAKGRPRAWRER